MMQQRHVLFRCVIGALFIWMFLSDGFFVTTWWISPQGRDVVETEHEYDPPKHTEQGRITCKRNQLPSNPKGWLLPSIFASTSTKTNDWTCQDAIGIQGGGRGRWKYVPNRTFAAPICCGYDNEHYKSNPTNCGEKPIQNPRLYHGKQTFYQQVGGQSCSCVNFKDHYVWQPKQSSSSAAKGKRKQKQKDTKQLPFDPHVTCSMLRNRTVLMIGDSTMGQTATTLMNALFPANCQIQVTYAASDTLVHQPFGGLNRGMHWKQWVKYYPSDIVIVTVGAHIFGFDNYTSVVDDVLRDMLTLLNEQKRNQNQNQQQQPLSNITAEPTTKKMRRISFVWKTQQPGGCSPTIFHPNNPAKAAVRLDYTNKGKFTSYQYEEFWQRDLYLLWRLQEVGIPSLDMRMLYSRSDAHFQATVNAARMDVPIVYIIAFQDHWTLLLLSSKTC